MNLKGTSSATNLLRGSINSLKTITLSAYAIAVQNGFEGTEEEWLASLKGEKGDPGELTEAQIAQAVEAYMMEHPVQGSGSAVRVADVELIAAKWVGNASPYSQMVTIPGVTAYSQIDLTPSVEQLTIFHDKDLAFVTENEDGIVTVFAIGQKPTNDYTIQATIKEVSV